MNTDNTDTLLPEEEQLYREFELYVRAISEEASRAMIARIDEFAQKLRSIADRLVPLPAKTQHVLDGATKLAAQMSHDIATNMQDKMDSNFKRLDELSRNHTLQMQQKLDNALQSLAQVSHTTATQIKQELDNSLQNLWKNSHNHTAQMQQKLDNALQSLAQVSHTTATQIKQELDNSLQNLEEILQKNVTYIEQKLDNSLLSLAQTSQDNTAQILQIVNNNVQRLSEGARLLEKNSQEITYRLNRLAERTEASADQQVATLRKLLIGVSTLVLINMLLHVMLLLRVWR